MTSAEEERLLREEQREREERHRDRRWQTEIVNLVLHGFVVKYDGHLLEPSLVVLERVVEASDREPVKGEWWVRRGTPGGTAEQRVAWAIHDPRPEWLPLRIYAFPGLTASARAESAVWVMAQRRDGAGAVHEMPLERLRQDWVPA